MVDYKLLDPPDRREKKGLGCYNPCFGYLNVRVVNKPGSDEGPGRV